MHLFSVSPMLASALAHAGAVFIVVLTGLAVLRSR
jgi:hypothetical protein